MRRIVTQEVAAFLSARRQASVTPTVVALRSMATSVVDAEMDRLAGRLPDLDAATRAEVLHTVRRVADKLLHEPTVRVKELANESGAVSYAAALAELFALDPEAVDAVTRPEGPRHDAPSASGPAPRSSPPPSPSWSPTRSPSGSAARSSWSRSAPRATAARPPAPRSPAPRPPASSSARCATRCSTAASTSPSTRSRTCRRTPPTGITLAAVPTREDPRDVVVARDGLTLGELPVGSRVGTGSPRRAAQLHALGLGVEVVGVRGNVDTRIAQGPLR